MGFDGASLLAIFKLASYLFSAINRHLCNLQVNFASGECTDLFPTKIIRCPPTEHLSLAHCQPILQG